MSKSDRQANAETERILRELARKRAQEAKSFSTLDDYGLIECFVLAKRNFEFADTVKIKDLQEPCELLKIRAGLNLQGAADELVSRGWSQEEVVRVALAFEAEKLPKQP